MFKINKKEDKLIGFRKRSKFSKGELRIAKFLAENRINFYPDFFFKEFKGKRLINSERNDFLKNAFCKKKKLNLLRIKYTDIDNIEKLICERFDLMDKEK